MSVSHEFPFTIRGEFIYLLQVQPRHAEFIYKLRISSAGKHLNQPKDYSIESQKKWIQSRSEDEANYIIYDIRKEIIVGMIGIYDCNFHDKVSNCGRLIIMPEYIANGSPYGLEALKLCYGYIFNEMNFRKISGTIAGSNPKIISLQKYLGMVQEGVLRGHALINGEYEDLHIYSLFREGYISYVENIDKLLEKYRL